MSNRLTTVAALAAQLSRFLFSGRLTAADRTAVTGAIATFIGKRVAILDNELVLNVVQPLRRYIHHSLTSIRDARTYANQQVWITELYRTVAAYEALVGEKPAISYKGSIDIGKYYEHPVGDAKSKSFRTTLPDEFGHLINFI